MKQIHWIHFRLVFRNYLLINKYRRREILGEIYRYVYPIEKDSQNRYSISNVKLPQASDQIYLYKLSKHRSLESFVSIGIILEVENMNVK